MLGDYFFGGLYIWRYEIKHAGILRRPTPYQPKTMRLLPDTDMAPSEIMQLCARASMRGTRFFVRQNLQTCMILCMGLVLLSVMCGISMITTAWFFLLGISSSIGFGVGVPTRVLFVIPYAIRNASGQHFLKDYASLIPVFIAHAVGSAVGELPPFLSSAVLTNYFNLSTGDTKIARLHQWIMKTMKGRRFLLIACLAAWPNATFDAAGLSAGASGMKMGAFLSATIIGKAFIRAPAACAIVLANMYNPWVKDALPDSMQSIFRRESSPRSMLGTLWSILVLMITLYTLLVTIIEMARIEKQTTKLRE